MTPAGSQAGPATIKCVAWDIDNTLIAGTFIESGPRQPPADPATAAALAELGRRGIVHAIASRNPPAAAAYAARVTGGTFVSVECGWDTKSAALARILAELGIGPDALAFVDDDPYERAEVSFALPEVLVLSPEDLADALGWPAFSPDVVTDEGRRRSELYLDRRRRQQAEREFGGSREDFLRYCRTEVSITPASEADVPRLHELSVRTHQFNSAGQEVTQAALRAMIGSAGCEVLTVRLRDRFGDDGIVGGCITEPGTAGRAVVRLLMMSCRAMGRGVIDALLAWLIRSAAGRGADAVEVPAVLNARNVPLRLALAAAGFRAASAALDPASAAPGPVWAAPAGPGPARTAPARTAPTRTVPAGPAAAAARGGPATGEGQRVLFRRSLNGPLPELPGWLVIPPTAGQSGTGPAPPGPAPGGAPVILAELRQILADVTGRPELLAAPAGEPLFGTGVALDSLSGTLLLREVNRRYGVDVAAEDINLDALASLATLADFIQGQQRHRSDLASGEAD
jgi:methoxymalonate biosynthesis protein